MIDTTKPLEVVDEGRVIPVTLTGEIRPQPDRRLLSVQPNDRDTVTWFFDLNGAHWKAPRGVFRCCDCGVVLRNVQPKVVRPELDVTAPCRTRDGRKATYLGLSWSKSDDIYRFDVDGEPDTEYRVTKHGAMYGDGSALHADDIVNVPKIKGYANLYRRVSNGSLRLGEFKATKEQCDRAARIAEDYAKSKGRDLYQVRVGVVPIDQYEGDGIE